MKYEVLARRYRPRRFEEVVGQESVAATLRGGIVQGRVAHAYLFTGPRGVGKTSMARIFAKALNCQRAAGSGPSDADWAEKVAALPCNACSTCEGIHIGQDIDVVEMDGASHRGIEDVRSIVESVNRPATRSTYKIFIIDEVHMLTREAFNALLKTLEEPPAHVKFIFATTEAHRIPDTVLSRCQRFDFHPIGERAIVLRLEQILASEGREAEGGLLEKIARYGRGGLRDAQTLLDQMLTFSEGVLRAEDLERITGRMPPELVRSLSGAVMAGDAGAVLAGLQRCSEKGADPAMLLEQVIEALRGEVHRMVLAESGTNGDRGPESTSLDRLLGAIQILLEAAGKLRHAALPAVMVEVVLLKVARLEEPGVLEEILSKLTALEEGTTLPEPTRSRSSSRSSGRSVGPRASGASSPRAVASKALPSNTPPSNAASSLGEPPPAAPRADDRPPAASPAASSPTAGDPPEAPPRVSPAGPVAGSPGGPASSVVSEPPVAAMAPARERRPEGAAVTSTSSAVTLSAVTSNEVTSSEVTSNEVTSNEGDAVTEGFSLERLLGLWNQIGIELQEHQPHIAPLVGDVEPEPHPDRRDTARLFFEDDFFLARMKSPQTRRAFESLVADVTGQAWKFDFVRRTGRSKRRGSGGLAGAGGDAPPGAAPRHRGRDASGSPSPSPPGGAPGVAGSEVVEKARKLFNGRIV